jgi:hypothetical protein
MMQKAMRLKAAKNLDPAGMKRSDSSFINFSNDAFCPISVV